MSVEKCPCNSGKSYNTCCKKLIQGEKKAVTAEELMRSRYSAYAKAEVDYILSSTHPDQRDANDRAEIKKWAENSEWHGLEIIKCEQGGKDDEEGTVEFIARYTDNGVSMDHHELAEFRKLKDDWYFYDGNLLGHQPFVRSAPKIGRNDPCPCGSGKKYKKCCG